MLASVFGEWLYTALCVEITRSIVFNSELQGADVPYLACCLTAYNINQEMDSMRRHTGHYLWEIVIILRNSIVPDIISCLDCWCMVRVWWSRSANPIDAEMSQMSRKYLPHMDSLILSFIIYLLFIVVRSLTELISEDLRFGTSDIYSSTAPEMPRMGFPKDLRLLPCAHVHLGYGRPTFWMAQQLHEASWVPHLSQLSQPH